jgi:uncharacterized protein (TIGR00369 family)
MEIQDISIGETMTLVDKGHSRCLLCGENNPIGLKLSFEGDEAGRVWARFKGRPELMGYDGLMHGGVIASLLDSAMTHCLFHQGIRALTGDLRVRYLRSVPMDAELVLGAWLVKKRAPLYYLQGEVRVGQQTLARAEATFMQQKRDS